MRVTTTFSDDRRRSANEDLCRHVAPWDKLGDPLANADLPLSLELGSGILDDSYDGIQRPLEHVLKTTQSGLVPRDVDVPNLDRDIAWAFTPGRLQVGDLVTDGDIAGTFREQGLFETH